VCELLLDGLDEPEFRLKCLELIIVFLRDMQLTVLKQDMEQFTNLIRIIFHKVFPKYTEVLDSEAPLLVSIVTEAGLKHINFLVTEMAVAFLYVHAFFFAGCNWWWGWT
jgi:hypothetical protein